jgi:uncharacterized coiled-coil protein SlyX
VNESTDLETRLIAIETQLMHLQRDFEQLNAECLLQQVLVQRQQKRIEFLENQLRTFSGGGSSTAIRIEE